MQRKIEGNRQAKLIREKFAEDQKALAARVDAGVSNADRFLQDPITYDRRDDAVVDYDTGEITPGRALMFSRQAEDQVKGSKKADVETIVKDLISDWENAPRIEVVQSISELPPDVQQQIKRENVNPKGLYVTKTKDVFLIADNLVNRTDTIMTAVHEAIGHFGMRSILGDRRDAVMREIYKGNKEVRDAVDEFRKSNPKMSLELAVEEVMAEMAYTSLQKYYSKKRLETSKPLRQLMQIIRRVLSQFPGIRMNAVSDLDVMELIANASRFVRKGEIKYDRFTEGKVREEAPTKKESEGVGLLKSPDTREANFKRWFGDSKVVDKDGKPLVIYRGLIGENEDALNAEGRKGYASFGSSSPYVASSYGNPDIDWNETGAVLPVYIKADRLIEFPVTEDRNGVRRFDKFEFDRRARSLKPSEVLVARQVIDIGPRASVRLDTDKLY